MTTIRFTSTIGGRVLGESADLDPASARYLVDNEYAERVDADDQAEAAPRPRRGRPPKAPTLVDGE